MLYEFALTLSDDKPGCVIVDMDGTLVDVSSIRHYVTRVRNEDGSYKNTRRDFDAFHKESVNCPAIWSTVDQVMYWWERRFDVVVVTARSDRYYRQTAWWLADYAIPHNALYMRSEGDYRPDYEVKRDILEKVRQKWSVVHAIDDNPAVIELWKENGINVTVVPGWRD